MAQVGETELDAGVLARALWRRAWLVVLLTALAAAGTYYALGFVEPLYTADTSILIEARESPLTRTREQAGQPVAEFDESAIQSQVQVLRSREIANAVIDRLDLTRRPEFDPATRPSLIGSLMVLVGAKRHPVDDTIRQRVMDSYFERLSVFPVQKSRVIAVEFSAPSPSLAAEVANAVAEAFVDMQQDAKRETAVAATAWLEQEIDGLRARVAEAEQAAAEYRANNELFDVDQTANLSTQQLSDLNAELARARAARAEAESRSELVASLLAEGGALEASQEVLESPLIQRLQERQVALRSEIADLSTTYLPGHPRIRAVEGQLANLEGQIRREAQKVQASLSTAARVAAAREQSLLASLNEAKVDVSRSDTNEIELRALEREAAAQRDLLESLLARYREALARTDTSYLPADARIISRAVAPADPSFPKKTMMALAAGLATFLLISAILLLREFTSGRAFRVVQYGYGGGPAAWREGQGYPLVPVIYSPPSARGHHAFDADAVSHPVSPKEPGRRRRGAGEPAVPVPPVVITPPAPALPEVEGAAERVSEVDRSAEFAAEPETPSAAVSEPDPASGVSAADDLAAAYTSAGDLAAAVILAEDAAARAADASQARASVVAVDATPAPADDFADAPPPAALESAPASEPLADEVPVAIVRVDDVPEPVALIHDAPEYAGAVEEVPDPAPSEVDHRAASSEEGPPLITTAGIARVADVTPLVEAPAADFTPLVEGPAADVTPLVEAPAADVAPLVEAPAADVARLVEAPVADAAPLVEAPAFVGAAAEIAENGDRPGTAELAEILASDVIRVAVFAGAQGGEGAGAIAFSAARHAARERLRFVLLDLGRTPSSALGGYEQPGLGELLGGEAAFGEVIQRDETSRLHFIPMGGLGDRPLQRLHIVIGALTHTYDKVLVVADRVADWPHEQVRPDLVAIICGPGSTEELRANVYDAALERGAASAIIVRYSSEPAIDHPESAAA